MQKLKVVYLNLHVIQNLMTSYRLYTIVTAMPTGADKEKRVLCILRN